jgi:hypothetical protein
MINPCVSLAEESKETEEEGRGVPTEERGSGSPTEERGAPCQCSQPAEISAAKRKSGPIKISAAEKSAAEFYADF